jgi:chromosome segregation ATPase
LFPLTDDVLQNGTRLAGVDFSGRNTDVFRQLLNQETLIRIALVKNVHGLMKDVVDLKQSLGTTTKKLGEAEKKITHLEQDVISLKTENRNLKEKASKLKHDLEDIGRNITASAEGRAEYERKLDTKLSVYEKNTSKILDNIKVGVRYLTFTVLDLKEQKLSVEKSIAEIVESKLSERIKDSKNLHHHLSKNVSDIENQQSTIMQIISGMWILFPLFKLSLAHMLNDLFHTIC